MNLFQVYDDPFPMAKEKYCLVFEYHLALYISLPARREFKNVCVCVYVRPDRCLSW